MITATSPAVITSDPAASPQRDRVLDLLRIAAFAVVVAWHWVFTTIWFDDGPHVGNPVGVTPGLWLLTWFLQPMPVFFAVGGALHARSYQGRPVAFWTRRVQRLLVPALPLLALAILAAGTAMVLGRGDVVRAVVLVISPLWFLATYLVLVLLAPLAVAAHRAYPKASLATVGVAVIALDVARFNAGFGGWIHILVAFALVWGFVHQLGFHLDALRRGTIGRRLAVMAGGLAALVLCVTAGPYSRAMVGYPGEKISNFGPPTLAVCCLAVFQLGLLACFEERIARRAERSVATLDRAERWIMPTYVWHLSGYVLFVGLLLVAGIEIPAESNGSWWLSRPLWVVGPAAFTVPLVVFVDRLSSRPGSRGRRRPSAATAI